MTLQSKYSYHESIYAANSNMSGWNSIEVDVEVLAYLRELIGAAGIKPSARILEIGCGMGNLTVPLARSGYDVVGIDISGTAITAAAQRAWSAGQTVHFLTGDVTQPEAYYGLRRFECVIDGLLLHCIVGADRARLLTQIRRALNPAGCFLVITMCGDPRSASLRERFNSSSREIVGDGIAQRVLHRPETLIEEFECSGFEVGYRRIVYGNDETGDQDMLLAAAWLKQEEQSDRGSRSLNLE